MKTEIFYFSGMLGISELVQNLKDGQVFKFVFEFRAKLLPAPEFLLVIGVASNLWDHEEIFRSMRQLKHSDHGHSVYVPAETLGGGSIKIENDKLLFFDSSRKYGVYNKELLFLGEYNKIKEIFKVKSVEFQ